MNVFKAPAFMLTPAELRYVNRMVPDVTFVFPCYNREIKAHRRILISRVPEFQILFHNFIVEKMEVKIPVHADPFLFRKLITYLYKGVIVVTKEEREKDPYYLQRLFSLADDFSIPISAV